MNSFPLFRYFYNHLSNYTKTIIRLRLVNIGEYSPRLRLGEYSPIFTSMVQDYEDNIIKPPPEFRDDYKIIQPPPEFRDDYKPTPLPETKIEQVDKALKGYTKSFEIGIKNDKDPLIQLQNTRLAIEHHINHHQNSGMITK